MDYKIPLESADNGAGQPQQSDSVTSESAPVPVAVPVSQDKPHVATPAEESSLLTTLQSSLSKLSTSIQDRADYAAGSYASKKVCKPGDVLCQAGAGFGIGNTHMKTELSKAVITSFGKMMSEMVNSTISRGLGEFMAAHGSSHGETIEEEHKAMVQMAANVLQTVSSRVIKSFTFFVQMAISGAMWDLFHQLMNGVTTAYDQHQKSMNEVRGAHALNSSPDKIPKPSQPQQQIFDPIKTLLNAGALTALSYPSSGFDLMGSLKSNLFTGDTNNLEKKGEATSNYIPARVLTPYGLLPN